MHRTRLIAALGPALILAVALTGCSIRIVDTARPSVDAPVTPSTRSQGVEPSATDDPSATSPTREDLSGRATMTQRCNGQLTLTQNGATVRVEGSCERLIINAQGMEVVTDDVTSLQVIGNANVILTGTLQSLTVNGNGNVVHWRGSTPAVSDEGQANETKAG